SCSDRWSTACQPPGLVNPVSAGPRHKGQPLAVGTDGKARDVAHASSTCLTTCTIGRWTGNVRQFLPRARAGPPGGNGRVFRHDQPSVGKPRAILAALESRDQRSTRTRSEIEFPQRTMIAGRDVT